MSNPRLNKEQLEKAKKLFESIKLEVEKLAEDDDDMLFAYRRKLYKELMHWERGTPMQRRKLKDLIWKRQKGICPVCNRDLPEKETELDRFEAKKGYKEENVRLIHHECHRRLQREKGFK